MKDNSIAQEGESRSHKHSFDISPREVFNDDGSLKTTWSVWSASARIIIVVMGHGVLSVAWPIAQLGWIAGVLGMFVFWLLTSYTSILLAACYCSGDPLTANTNYTYMDAVRSNLGGVKVKICGVIHCLKLFGGAICCINSASLSMAAIKWSNCIHQSSGANPCKISNNLYMILFGTIEIISSQIPDFARIWWLSIVAVIMVFTYSTISLVLVIAKVAETGKFMGSLTGISIGSSVSPTQKIWRSFQALGNIAFAYSYSEFLVEIEDKIKSPPSEAKTMKKANLANVAIVTLLYVLCGCMGYAAFGDLTPRNILDGFHKPYWLVDIANAAFAIQQVVVYQLNCHPIFAFIEKTASETFPQSEFITNEINIPIPCFKLNLFRLAWRTIFVIITILIANLVTSIDVVSILEAIGFWPLAVYFPIEMYIAQKNIPKSKLKWLSLKAMSVACLLITITAASGSVAEIAQNINFYRPFKTYYNNSIEQDHKL